MQIANRGSDFRLSTILSLVQESLDSHFSLTYAMCLKPMYFRKAYRAVEQTDSCNPFQFPPTTWAVPLPQKGKYTNATTRGYRFDIGDLADDFELH